MNEHNDPNQEQGKRTCGRVFGALALMTSLAAFACVADSEDPDAAASMGTAETGDDTSGADLDAGGEDQDTGDADDGVVGGDGDGDGDGDPGGEQTAGLEPCTAVDLLFVVDNSDSMAEEQAKLLTSASGFIDDAAGLLAEGTNFHVGVVSTDSADLVRKGAGGLPCGFFEDLGVPFMEHVGSMNAALDTGLSCAVDLGVDGSPDERPIEFALAALGPAANLADGPNPGFVREDAVLVIVIVSDEEDDHEAVTSWGSAGDPEDWIDELSVLVDGVEERVVVLTLVGHEKPNACPGFQWDGHEGAELAPRLIAFTEAFEHGMVGDVCGTSYGDFFAQAAFEVADACGGS